MQRPGELHISIDAQAEEAQRISHVRCQGEIDLSNFEELSQALSECAGSEGILLDLRQVEFVDSSGLRAMLDCANERGPRFATLISEESAVGSLFDMVNVHERLNVRENERDALDSLAAAAG